VFQVATDATRSIDRAIAQPTNVNGSRRSGYERFYTLWAISGRSQWLPVAKVGVYLPERCSTGQGTCSDVFYYIEKLISQTATTMTFIYRQWSLRTLFQENCKVF
jgi:hypothetical protein